MFSRPKFLFLVSLLFVALLNPKFNPYLLFKFLIFYHSSIDTCLPFGLRSAPFLFNQLADAIHWILHQQYGVRHLLHYLDDFLTAGPPNSNACHQNLSYMLSLCNRIGTPIKTEKVEGPGSTLIQGS